MNEKLTQQQIIGMYASHHRTWDLPSWSTKEDEWPVCTKCKGDILISGNEESGPIWACKDPICEMA